MASNPSSTDNECEASAWSLLSFTIDHEFKSSGPSMLYLDRANGEFGIVYPSPTTAITLAQFPDDEPIYFQGKNVRATCWRSKCKKVTLLFEFLQVDLEFDDVQSACAFEYLVEQVVMTAGNHFFCSYEVPS
jgi:hypothetical protein